jgi:hypothetical protein
MSRKHDARAWEMFLRLAPTSCAMAGGLIDQLGTGKLAEWCYDAVETFHRATDDQEPDALVDHKDIDVATGQGPCEGCGGLSGSLTITKTAGQSLWLCRWCGERVTSSAPTPPTD